MAMNLSKELKGSLRRHVMKEQLCGIDNGKDSIVVAKLKTTEDRRVEHCETVRIYFNQNDYPYISIGQKPEPNPIEVIHNSFRNYSLRDNYEYHEYHEYEIKFKDDFCGDSSIQVTNCRFEYHEFDSEVYGKENRLIIDSKKIIKIGTYYFDKERTEYKFKQYSKISSKDNAELKNSVFIYVIFTNVFNCPIIRVSSKDLDYKDVIDLYSTKFIFDSYTEPINQTKNVITNLTGKPASAKMIAEGMYTNSCAGKENISVNDNNIITRYSNPFTHISFVKKDIGEEVNIEETTYEINGKKLYLKYRWYNKYTHDLITYNISDLAIRISTNSLLCKIDINDIYQSDQIDDIGSFKDEDPKFKEALAEILKLIKYNTKSEYIDFNYCFEVNDQKLAEISSTEIRSIITVKLFDEDGSVLSESNYVNNNWIFASNKNNIYISYGLSDRSPMTNYKDNDLYLEIFDCVTLHKVDHDKRIIYLGENDKVKGYSYGGDKNSLEEKNLVLIRDEFGVPRIYTLKKFTK